MCPTGFYTDRPKNSVCYYLPAHWTRTFRPSVEDQPKTNISINKQQEMKKKQSSPIQVYFSWSNVIINRARYVLAGPWQGIFATLNTSAEIRTGGSLPCLQTAAGIVDNPQRMNGDPQYCAVPYRRETSTTRFGGIVCRSSTTIILTGQILCCHSIFVLESALR